MTRHGAAPFVALLLAASALAGCGSDRPVGNRVAGRTLTVYWSGPSVGASHVADASALGGAEIALADAHNRIGHYRVVLKALDDASLPSGGWDPNQTTANVQIADQDPTTIGYLGDYNSGASAVAIPPLNRAGIAQISPASSAVGLTTAGPGASPGEPQKYYPTRARTFARVVPSDAIQALALVQVQQAMGCRSTFVLQDGEVDGEDAAISFVLTAKSAGLRVLAVQAFPRRAPDYSSLAAGVGGSGADCVLISAIDERSAARLVAQLAHALPGVRIFATAGLADSTFTDPARGGIPASVDSRVIVVSPALGAWAYPPSCQAFLASYRQRYGSPEPSAIFGYAAMELMLHAIARATDNGRKAAERSKVIAALLPTNQLQSVLGTYGIDDHGDTTIRRYGIYRVVDGKLSPLGLAG